jgi:alpha-tubulin suppressor-like RCC1 family protein
MHDADTSPAPARQRDLAPVASGCRGLVPVRWRALLLLASVLVGVAVAPAAGASRADGRSSVVAWGANAAGQLGDGRTSPGSDVPVSVKLPARTRVIAITVGGHHSLAVTSTGQVLAWGINVDGELGDGKTTYRGGPPKARLDVDTTLSRGALVKVKLPAGTKVTTVAAADAHSCSNTSLDGGYSLALTSTGAALAWGYNGYGELGDGRTAQSDVPVFVKLPAGTKVTAIAAGGYHSLALTSTGQVLAGGDNAYGQLGDGRTAHSDVPVSVKLPAGTKVTAIAAGCDHSLAVTSTGQVLAWGDNAYGQLGDVSTTRSEVPVTVKLPGTQVTAVAAGNDHSLALTSTGQILAWGDDDLGELGDGNTTQSHVPVTVRLPTGTKAVKLGAGSVGDYSLALVHHA